MEIEPGSGIDGTGDAQRILAIGYIPVVSHTSYSKQENGTKFIMEFGIERFEFTAHQPFVFPSVLRACG